MEGENDMKKHKVLKVAIITLLICALLTWIIPCATYQMEYSEIGRYQVGLFDILSYQSTVLGYFGYVALFVLVVGGFYGVLFKTGAYRAMLDSICKKFKGKETIFVIVIISLFAILTSFAGSISIIGIALILSLSNGVNTYIKSVEEDTLSEYPLQIQSSGVDISSILMGTSSEANYEETSKKWRRFKNSWNYTAKRRGNKYYANVWNILSSIFNRTCN